MDIMDPLLERTDQELAQTSGSIQKDVVTTSKCWLLDK